MSRPRRGQPGSTAGTRAPSPAAAARRPAPPSPRSIGRVELAAALGLLLLCVAVYAPVRQHDFVNFDDPEYVVDNPMVNDGVHVDGIVRAFTRSHSANWHPLTWLSHMLDVELFGLEAGAHLRTNVFLHAVAACALFFTLTTMTGRTGRAFVIAALFAGHPLRVESVAWVSERKDVLCAALWMLALLAYARAAASRGSARTRWRVAVLALAVLALLAKPMAVTLPLTLLLLDFWPLQRPGPWTALVREKLPLFGLAGGVALITFIAQSGAGAVASSESLPLPQRLAGASLAVIAYLRDLVRPTALSAFYRQLPDLPASHVAACAIAIVGLSALAYRVRQSRPWWFAGWLWFLVTLLPVIGIVKAGDQARADRFTYVPSVGLTWAVVWEFAELFGRVHRAWLARAIAATLSGAVIVTLALGARDQVLVWADSETLFRHALALDPDNDLAHTNLGEALNAMGRAEEARRHHLTALHLAPHKAKVQTNAGIVREAEGDPEAALVHYTNAIRLDPRYPTARLDRGLLLTKLGRTAPAIDDLTAALALDPGYVKVHLGLAQALAADGRFAEAEHHAAEAVRLAPRSVEARGIHALVLEDARRPDEAVAEYRVLLGFAPGESGARLNLAEILAARGEGAAARAELERALQDRPGWLPAVARLALLLATDPDPQVRAGARALALTEESPSPDGPSPIEILDARAAALAELGRFAEAAALARRASAAAVERGNGPAAAELARRADRYASGRPLRLPESPEPQSRRQGTKFSSAWRRASTSGHSSS